MTIWAESRSHVLQIEAESGKPRFPPKCVLLEFNLETIFGKKFFPQPKTETTLITDRIHISTIKSGTEDIAFEMHGICGIKKIFIAGFTTKYHLEKTLELLKPLGVVHVLMDCLSVMDLPEPLNYFLELKRNFGNIHLCLSGDLAPVILERDMLFQVSSQRIPRA